MQVLKFGGTSVANAENIKKVITIVSDAIKKEPTIVVVSALGGVTDLLLDAATLASQGKETYIEKLNLIEQRHKDCINNLISESAKSPLIQMLEKACTELIVSSKEIWQMGGGQKVPAKEEQVTIDFAFATVCSIASIKKGEKLSKENIWVKRPGTGKILAEHFNDIVGKIAVRDIENDEQLDFTDFE